MPTKNTNLLDELNQIRRDQESINDRLDKIKQESDADLVSHLEKIERNSFGVVFEIDEIKKQTNRSAFDEQTQIERNSILRRMPANRVNPNRVRIGGIWVD